MRASYPFLDDAQRWGMKLGLARVRSLLAENNNPQNGLNIIHIAGTNGKGSVASLLHYLFSQSNVTSGLFTSPHLVDVRERISVNSKNISEELFGQLLNKIERKSSKSKPTYFEVLTLLALLAFKKSNVDYSILETGLGGRLDATNGIDP